MRSILPCFLFESCPNLRSTFKFLLLCFAVLNDSSVMADVKLPNLFSDHAVLQRDQDLLLWGWAEPNERVIVELDGQTQSTTADSTGHWRVTLPPLAAGGPYTLTVQGRNRLKIADVLIGDVWLCSGQSNMELPVSRAKNADLEIAAANFPQIRFLTVSSNGAQEPLDDVDGRWSRCSPESVHDFSAIAFFFGRQLNAQLEVPIGLIDNAYGGSACEAWISRPLLEANRLYAPQLSEWDKKVAAFDEPIERAKFEKLHAEWEAAAKDAAKAGLPEPPNRPRWATPRLSQLRPANLFNARLKPLVPFAIRGVIWYQGESNVDRAQQYREMFPLLINSWREEWQRPDLPFYWVQLADFMAEKPEPSESAWAELREAQSMTLDRVPYSGQAVAIDLGEANDIHPRNKQEVAHRLARLALAGTYDIQVASHSPRIKSVQFTEAVASVKFKNVNGGLQSWEGKPVTGFALAGLDKKWHWADAEIVGDDEIKVHSQQVGRPVAVRYAWADNPLCNVYDMAGLPLTPFRTDDWPPPKD